MSPLRRGVFGIVIVGVAATAVTLGRWQLRRLAARRASNRVMVAARTLPPLLLPGVVPVADSGRRATARGHFDTAGQILLRGRVQDEAPGLQVVTAFVLDSGGPVLWVVRGFVRSPDATSPPDTIATPTSGTVTINGLLYVTPVLPDSGKPLLHDRVRTWARLDRGTLTAVRAGSMGVYLLLDSSAATVGGLPTVPPPELSEGPHLSYAIQWFGIALAVFTFGVLMLWREGRAVPPDLQAP